MHVKKPRNVFNEVSNGKRTDGSIRRMLLLKLMSWYDTDPEGGGGDPRASSARAWDSTEKHSQTCNWILHKSIPHVGGH